MRVILKLSVAILLGGTLALSSPALAGNNAPSQAVCAAAAVMSANAHAKGKSNQWADTILVMCAAATPAQPAGTYGSPPPTSPTDQYGNPIPQGSPPPTPTDQYGNPLPQGSSNPNGSSTPPTSPTDQYGNPLPQGSASPTPTDQYGNPIPQGSSGNPYGTGSPPTTPMGPSLNDFAGNWLVTADKTFLMQLYVTGSTITGTYDATGRNGTLTNGTLNGDTLSYSWVQTGTIKLNGTGTFRLTTPNHMDGTWTAGTYSGTWSGDRQ